MKRKWIRLSDIDPFDQFHQPDGDWFKIVKPDPQDQSEHQKGVLFIEKKIRDGVKIMPILVQETEGKYKRYDGFKRYFARKKAGYESIECFVCEKGDEGKTFNFDGRELRCVPGGQTYREFPMVEYNECPGQESGSGKIDILYNGGDFRIELREAVHIHWGKNGRYRLLLGEKDFKILNEAINGKSN